MGLNSGQPSVAMAATLETTTTKTQTTGGGDAAGEKSKASGRPEPERSKAATSKRKATAPEKTQTTTAVEDLEQTELQLPTLESSQLSTGPTSGKSQRKQKLRFVKAARLTRFLPYMSEEGTWEKMEDRMEDSEAARIASIQTIQERGGHLIEWDDQDKFKCYVRVQPNSARLARAQEISGTEDQPVAGVVGGGAAASGPDASSEATPPVQLAPRRNLSPKPLPPPKSKKSPRVRPAPLVWPPSPFPPKQPSSRSAVTAEGTLSGGTRDKSQPTRDHTGRTFSSDLTGLTHHTHN